MRFISNHKKLTYLFRYLNDDLQLFRDREDPVAVYVIIKNKLQDCLLKDFHLNNAISLAGRLYHALPDQYINARHYVDEVRKVLQSKVGDHTFTRKMGLNISSMLLGLEHQRKFDCLMARVDDSPFLKEPFDREIRGKMVNLQKQALDGLDKFQHLGALSKKSTDLLGMYTTNKMPVPASRQKIDGRLDRQRRRSHPDRRSQSDRKSRSSIPSKRIKTESGRTDRTEKGERRQRRTTGTERPQKEVETKTRIKGEKKAKISKINKKDLQQIIQLAVSTEILVLMLK